MVVQPRAELSLSRHDSPPRVWLPVGLGNRGGVVVGVAASVRPAGLVHQDDGRIAPVLERATLERAQLVEDRVPVVVSVDQGQIDVRDLLEHVEAPRAVEAQVLAVLGEKPVDAQSRVGVDGVQQRPVVLCPGEQGDRDGADVGSDLDDHPRGERIEQGIYEELQKPVHGGLGPPRDDPRFNESTVARLARPARFTASSHRV